MNSLMLPTRDQKIAAVLAYWEGLRGGRAMPSRLEIDPTVIPRSVLPRVFLIDFIDTAPWARFRLAGTELETEIGLSLKGKTLAELPLGDELESFTASLFKVRDQRQPSYREHRFVDGRGLPVAIRLLLLPLSSDAETVDGVFGASVEIH